MFCMINTSNLKYLKNKYEIIKKEIFKGQKFLKQARLKNEP